MLAARGGIWTRAAIGDLGILVVLVEFSPSSTPLSELLLAWVLLTLAVVALALMATGPKE